jgi:hypothetical protein
MHTVQRNLACINRAPLQTLPRASVTGSSTTASYHTASSCVPRPRRPVYDQDSVRSSDGFDGMCDEGVRMASVIRRGGSPPSLGGYSPRSSRCAAWPVAKAPPQCLCVCVFFTTRGICIVCCLLPSGYCLLYIGYCILAIGYWLLAIVQRGYCLRSCDAIEASSSVRELNLCLLYNATACGRQNQNTRGTTVFRGPIIALSNRRDVYAIQPLCSLAPL